MFFSTSLNINRPLSCKEVVISLPFLLINDSILVAVKSSLSNILFLIIPPTRAFSSTRESSNVNSSAITSIVKGLFWNAWLGFINFSRYFLSFTSLSMVHHSDLLFFSNVVQSNNLRKLSFAIFRGEFYRKASGLAFKRWRVRRHPINLMKLLILHNAKKKKKKDHITTKGAKYLITFVHLVAKRSSPTDFGHCNQRLESSRFIGGTINKNQIEYFKSSILFKCFRRKT